MNVALDTLRATSDGSCRVRSWTATCAAGSVGSDLPAVGAAAEEGALDSSGWLFVLAALRRGLDAACQRLTYLEHQPHRCHGGIAAAQEDAAAMPR